MILDKKQSEEFEGKLLLQLFREEQAKGKRMGCSCSDCQKDMINAWKRFKTTVFEKVKP